MFYVSNNAICQCDKGMIPDVLMANQQMTMMSDGEFLCTILDHEAMSFGRCKQDGLPCVPAIVVDFQIWDSKIFVDGQMLLLDQAKLRCVIGGEISINFPMNITVEFSPVPVGEAADSASSTTQSSSSAGSSAKKALSITEKASTVGSHVLSTTQRVDTPEDPQKSTKQQHHKKTGNHND